MNDQIPLDEMRKNAPDVEIEMLEKTEALCEFGKKYKCDYFVYIVSPLKTRVKDTEVYDKKMLGGFHLTPETMHRINMALLDNNVPLSLINHNELNKLLKTVEEQKEEIKRLKGDFT